MTAWGLYAHARNEGLNMVDYYRKSRLRTCTSRVPAGPDMLSARTTLPLTPGAIMTMRPCE
jgi:hypothetical protein